MTLNCWLGNIKRSRNNDELLNKISLNLNFPKEFFFEQYTPIDTEYKLHRKQAALKQTELSYISSNSNIIDMEIGKLLNSLEIDTSIPEKLNLDYLDSPEDVAIALREYLSLPKGSVYNITNLIESLGIIIVNFDYPDIKFDGVSFYNKKNIPIMNVKGGFEHQYLLETAFFLLCAAIKSPGLRVICTTLLTISRKSLYSKELR